MAFVETIIDEGVEVAKMIVVTAGPSEPYKVESTVESVERSVTPKVDAIDETLETLVEIGSPSGPVDAAIDPAMTDDTPVASAGSIVEPSESVLTTPFCARLKLIELELNSVMFDELPLTGSKVVLRLLSPIGRFVTSGGGIMLEPSTGPGVTVLKTELFAAKVAFAPSPGVELVVVAVELPYNAVVVIELEFPSSVVATAVDAEVMKADPIPDSIIDVGISVPNEVIVELVVSIPMAPLVIVDSI